MNRPLTRTDPLATGHHGGVRDPSSMILSPAALQTTRLMYPPVVPSKIILAHNGHPGPHSLGVNVVLMVPPKKGRRREPLRGKAGAGGHCDTSCVIESAKNSLPYTRQQKAQSLVPSQIFFGCPRRTRTFSPPVKGRMLYQLSYRAMGRPGIEPGCSRERERVYSPPTVHTL